MVTRMFAGPRRADLSISDFQEHWRVRHAPIILRLPGLRGYVQNHTVLQSGRPLLPYVGFDCLPESDFDDMPSMQRALADPEIARALAVDEPNFIARGAGGWSIVGDREVRLEGTLPVGAVKLMTFFRIGPRAARDAFIEALRGPYAIEAAKARPARHEQVVVREGAEQSGCEAIDALWFESPDRAVEYVSSEAAFSAESKLVGLAFGRERVVVAPIRLL